MVIKHLKERVFFLVACLCLIACSHDNVNSINHPEFDDDGVIKEEVYNSFYSAEPPSSICFYVEASGSMNGLFRPGKATTFKRNMWSVLSRNRDRISSVKAFVNGSSNVVEYSIDDFRSKMNNGGLVSAASTVVPKMLQKVLEDLEAGLCDVAVFVSDMKYSPAGGSVTAIDQYAIDIQSMFSKYSGYSLSMIGLESEYIAANGSVACSEFPYYMIVIGKSSKVTYVRNVIMAAIGQEKSVVGCLDYNIVCGCPYYSVYPIAGALGLKQNIYEIAAGRADRFYSLCGYSSTAGVAEFVVAIRGYHIPYSLLTNIQKDNFVLGSYAGSVKLDWELINEPSIKSAEDKKVNQFVEPNIFLKVKIEEMYLPSDVINIVMKTPKDDDLWIQKYCGATREGDLYKTFSIDGFVEGLKRAYPAPLNVQTDPMLILVSDYN